MRMTITFKHIFLMLTAFNKKKELSELQIKSLKAGRRRGFLCSTETGTTKRYRNVLGTRNDNIQKFKIRERHRYGNKKHKT